jgi:copper chaperone
MKTSLQVQNLKCGGCAKTITEKMASISGVSNVDIDVANSIVDITFENEETIALVEKALAAIGYPLVGDKNSVLTKAKSFVSCATGKLSQ